MRYLKNEKLLIVIIIYLFITTNLIIQNSTLYSNLINPLFWACILIYLIWDMKKGYIRFSKNKRYFINIVIISIVNVIIFFYLGFIFGFVKSSYNHEIIVILKNITIQILPIISIELVRGVIITRNTDNKILIAFVTIVLILVEINYNALINLFSDKENFFKYSCSNIIPLIACSSLYTYLTLKGSYSLSLTYRLFNQLAILLLPVLPNIDWFVTGSIGILSPTLIYVLFKYKFIREKEDIRKKQEYFSAKIIYAVTLILCITLVCFMLGLFRYEPITMLSNSMFPSFSRGDVVIYKKMSDSELKNISINSIIIYTIGDQNIAHRVINMIQKNDNVLYQTKGDYNNAPDINLVGIDQIKGVYIFHIKYIGFPSVWLYDYFNNEDARVEIK